MLRRWAAMAQGGTVRRWFGAAAVGATTISLIVSLAVVPADARQGPAQRLMYVHVPSAWLAYLAFAVVCAASLAYLRTGRTRWDRIAEASAEVGVVFTALTLVLGSLWGRPVWGTWWTWDPRLTTTAVLLLIYAGYLAVRRMPDSPERAYRHAAVVGVTGFLDVPIVHMSVIWWHSLHQRPTVLRIDGAPTLAPGMLATLLLALVAFTLFYAWAMTLRLRLRRLTERATADALREPGRRELPVVSASGGPEGGGR